MKILVVFFIFVLLSTSLAKVEDRRKLQKPKTQPIAEENRNHQDWIPFYGYRNVGGLPGNRQKLRIPYVDDNSREKTRIPYVDDGSREKTRIPYVDEGSREKTRIPYVDEGSREKTRIPYVDEGKTPNFSGGPRENPQVPYVDEKAREKLRTLYGKAGNREKPRIPYVDEKDRDEPNTDEGKRGRQPRQSVLTIQVPAGGNHNGGNFQLTPPLQFPGSFPSANHNQGSGGFVQGPPLQFVGSPQGGHPGNQGSGIQQDTQQEFQGSFQGGNRPGNHGSQQFPGVIISGPGFGNQGGGGIFSPGSSGLFPGNPGHPGGGSGISSSGGPGGLSSSPDSGLAGGLGGVYGGGYGFGLGGLVFGGPAGPVFAGNAALIDSAGGTSEESEDEEEEEDEKSDKQKAAPQTPLFRPVPVLPRSNLFFLNTRGVKNANMNNQESHSAGNGHPKVPTHPDASRNAGASNTGETIGYVAFIFPRRSTNRPPTQTTVHSKGTDTHKATQEADKSKPKVTAKTKYNRVAPIFVPVPVQVPIDRPYPVPVPYEVARPFPVPVAVDVPKPPSVDIPVLIGGHSNLFVQPSIIHKPSDYVTNSS